MSILLRGITWNHTRGYLPMVATSQRYSELFPNVTIQWDKRSLQEFADLPIQALIDQYDLLVIDHPWAGYAADSRVLLPLNEYLPEDYMRDQAANSVGGSHASYQFDGSQTALAIDAATPVASWRDDLLQQQGLELPANWDQLLQLAGKGVVAFPAIPIDSLMNFYMFCLANGEEPFISREEVVSSEIGHAALEALRELASLCSADIFRWNPIAVYEAMAQQEHVAYCPFAYGYSNYGRAGYGKHRLSFGGLVAYKDNGPLRSTLGGTGLAVSASSKYKSEALGYAEFAASPEIQKTLYTASGGQPGHRKAWTDEDNNRQSGQYFANTLSTLDQAYVRPRYNGYLHFQDHAGDYVRDYMMHGGDHKLILEQMNRLYRESLNTK
ncbi:ABC transporter substrate-binding protein [Paenibacillus radicis (ex Xue et al. 2023)]|uniref:Extracellular solute-binding protein n=1 Tax=Paenibacillus radicis (ex Xue et al. 2023) TaxID=2972489 RepID=A0ABT1YDM1_9BACL|nr:extracellular solute-binding protein [Paenibacillus radicis (ex Xue et al. 2023)]MCR8631282.1 extracellular solute-binding protein [Paenibacillus radicis (ex Xue et al. 2023)]